MSFVSNRSLHNHEKPIRRTKKGAAFLLKTLGMRHSFQIFLGDRAILNVFAFFSVITFLPVLSSISF